MQTPFESIKEQVEKKNILPKPLLDKLPRRWEKIGDVLILKLPRELGEYREEIGEIYAKILSCKTVLNDHGGIKGVYRKPMVEIIYGSSDTETIHVENGIRFQLDPQRIMFSSGNIDERIRMSRISKPGERIVDLFAGIGYFTIPIAVYSKPEKIISCEINPIAYNYLCRNIVLNHVTEIVEPRLGDNREVSPEDYADRVIMGYIGDTKDYLPVAFNTLREHRGIIHYHDTFPDEEVPETPLKLIQETARKFNRKVFLVKYRKVKNYAPGISHYVFDVRIN